MWNDFLQYCESASDVARERRKAKVSAAIEQFTDAEVWAEVERRKGGPPPVAGGIRDAEFQTLMSSAAEVGEDRPDGDFHARSVTMPAGEPQLTAPIARVVKVHRLREVIAQVGFTRFEASVPDVNGELALGVERAALSHTQRWLPAVENCGEGIFIGFDAATIEAWATKPAVRQRRRRLFAGFEAWRNQHQAGGAAFPGLPYVMLHTLSHLLITAVALECGYAASSIRERIYVGESAFGLMLYTASPDAEGTLGGLVQAADSLDRYLRRAVDLGRP